MKRVFLERRVFISWIFVFAIAIFIFYISSLTFKGIGVPTPMTYIYHFFIFFWLSFFLTLAMARAKNVSLAIPSLFLSLVYALSDEIHQLFVPGRSCSLGDFLTDSSGIILASMLYLITIKIRNKSNNNNPSTNKSKVNLLRTIG